MSQKQAPLTMGETIELAMGSNFYTFKLLPDGVEVGEWYGYDVRGRNKLSLRSARNKYRELTQRGYQVERRWLPARQVV